MKFDRQNINMLSSWWHTVDKVALCTILSVIAVGMMLVTTASPAVAERIGLGSYYFVKRQMVYLSLSLVVIFAVSLLSAREIRRFSLLGFGFGLVLLCMVLLIGQEANGAKRWLFFFGFSLQPSEFMKPFFIIVTAWILSEARARPGIAKYQLSVVLYAMVIVLLISQPDFGMVVVISAVWAGQLFLAGIPMVLVAGFVVFGFIGIVLAYFFLPHVTYRINSFLGSGQEMSYQVKKSLEAFQSGGLMGQGPGEGVVKSSLPDSHTDFIFAVAGEELGAIMCVVIMLLYATIVLRGLRLMLDESDLFIVYATSGLLMQFGMQAMVNMGVALNLLPTKGMTLPFISYGGSSMLAIAISMGMVLGLTRRRFGVISERQVRLEGAI